MRNVQSSEVAGAGTIGHAASDDVREQFGHGASGWWRDLWRYRELLFFLAWRDFRVRYRQTLLGVLWALIQPVFTMAVFALLFGGLVKMPSDGMPYPVFYYAALLPWTYFSTVVSLSALSLVNNTSLITKVYFPRVFLPISPALTGLVDLGIGSVLLVALLAWYGVPFTWKLALWPGLISLLFALTFSIGALLAALNVRYRDIKHALPLILQIWLFATPIIYPLNLVPERFRVFAFFNPLTGIVGAFRAACSPTISIDWRALLVSVAVTALLAAAGLFYFTRTEREFADVA